MKCEECGASADRSALGWRAYRIDDPDGLGDPDDPEERAVVFYCPSCAEREFADDAGEARS